MTSKATEVLRHTLQSQIDTNRMILEMVDSLGLDDLPQSDSAPAWMQEAAHGSDYTLGYNDGLDYAVKELSENLGTLAHLYESEGVEAVARAVQERANALKR